MEQGSKGRDGGLIPRSQGAAVLPPGGQLWVRELSVAGTCMGGRRVLGGVLGAKARTGFRRPMQDREGGEEKAPSLPASGCKAAPGVLGF